MSPESRSAAPPAWGFPTDIPAAHVERFTARRDELKAAYQHAVDRAADARRDGAAIPEALESEVRRRRAEWEAAERDLAVMQRRAEGRVRSARVE